MNRQDMLSEAAEAREIARLHQAFEALCRKRDLGAIAPFAPLVTDWDNKTNGVFARRFPTLQDLLEDSADYGDNYRDLLQLLLDVAYGDAPQIAAARVLIFRMAKKWANQNAVFEDAAGPDVPVVLTLQADVPRTNKWSD